MPPEAVKRIWDAAEACRRIETFVEGKSREEFAASELLRAAVERQLEIVGEALNNASSAWPQLAFEVPEIPRIVGLRNRLIHGYDRVDDELVWDVVVTKISPLRATLDALQVRQGF
jgi:uncharacterized protein with HEPN domain